MSESGTTADAAELLWCLALKGTVEGRASLFAVPLLCGFVGVNAGRSKMGFERVTGVTSFTAACHVFPAPPSSKSYPELAFKNGRDINPLINNKCNK